MKKIAVIITVILLSFQINLKAQVSETIVDKLNNSNEKSTYLKDFSFELGPGENAKYSIVLSKTTKYEFSIYLNNLQLDFELYKDKSETNLLTEKEKLLDQIIKADFIPNQSSVYHIIIKNNSDKVAKSVLLLSVLEFNSVSDNKKESSKNAINNSDDKITEASTSEKEEIFLNVEQMPRFNGATGNDETSENFKEFIVKNTIYPAEAQAKTIRGTVYVSFVVDKEGYIKSAKVVRAVHPALDQEALRVILSSPRWEPGKEKGKPVNVSYTIPIIFNLK